MVCVIRSPEASELQVSQFPIVGTLAGSLLPTTWRASFTWPCCPVLLNTFCRRPSCLPCCVLSSLASYSYDVASNICDGTGARRTCTRALRPCW